MIAPPSTVAPEGSSVSLFRTDRLVLWTAMLFTVAVTVVRLSGQLLERITTNDRVRDLAAELNDRALAELAVRMGVVLAVVISAVFQLVYLSLCAMVDEKVLVAVMTPTRRRVDRSGRRPAVGPAMIVGIAATLPVQLAALALGLASPKDSPLLAVWLVLVVGGVFGFVCSRPAFRARGSRARVLLASLLVVVAAISFLL
ncbi:hypothetical protein [Rathayibacter sp. VKM Ac-2927]|uniref:hypothetical protein n=1 Tax=Rathayibacter sp. VKM Ac-2927 TaxID=2929478 RepID=UPI001FB354B7|nr:hypothetical protein [Rathayibacter sp. VKM Ac-2927]MCJ1685527.1 hypothetical protein [Rathayibacter sp. VKM Ac-2927]